MKYKAIHLNSPDLFHLIFRIILGHIPNIFNLGAKMEIKSKIDSSGGQKAS